MIYFDWLTIVFFTHEMYFIRRQYFVYWNCFEMPTAVYPKSSPIIILKNKLIWILYILITNQVHNIIVKTSSYNIYYLSNFCTEYIVSLFINPANNESSTDIFHRLNFIACMFIISVLPSTTIEPEIWPNWSNPNKLLMLNRVVKSKIIYNVNVLQHCDLTYIKTFTSLDQNDRFRV